MSKLKQALILAGAVAAAIVALVIWRDIKFLENVKSAIRAKRVEEKTADIREAIRVVDSKLADNADKLKAIGLAYEEARGNVAEATPEQIQQFYLEFFGK